MSEAQEQAIELVDAGKRKARAAIEGVWKEYHREDDGLKLLEQKVATSTARCSAYIYGLAQFAAENCPRKHKPWEVFAALCAYAEAGLKEKYSVENLADALPVWKTYKSNILTRMRDLGLNPTNYATEYEFRKAGDEARISSIDERREAIHSVTTSQSDQVTQVEVPEGKLTIAPTRKFLRATPIASSIKLILAQLVVEAGYIRKGREDEAEAIIREAREKLAALVDRRRITDEATKSALTRAA